METQDEKWLPLYDGKYPNYSINEKLGVKCGIRVRKATRKTGQVFESTYPERIVKPHSSGKGTPHEAQYITIAWRDEAGTNHSKKLKFSTVMKDHFPDWKP